MRFSFSWTLSLCCFIAAISAGPSSAANVPAGYSVYSYEELKIGNSAGVSGGIIGGKATVLVGVDARVSGSIIANGAVTLYDRSRVDGDVKSGNKVNLINGATIGGTKTQYATVPTYTIPTKTITVGTTNKTVLDRGSMTIDPGNYGTITVGNGATVTLKNGIYNINTLTIWPDAKIKLDFPATGGITINVKTSFTYSDRVKMQFVTCTDGSLVSVYYHGTAALYIGNDAVAFGAFSAPNAQLTVNDRAQFSGSVYAKKVELKPGLFAEGMVDQWLKVDSDGDGVPDYVENSMGTGSTNANDKPAVVVEGTYANKTRTGPQTVVLSVFHEIGYSRNKVRITFSKGSLSGDLIPIVDIISKPATVDTIPTENGNIQFDGVAGQPKIFLIKGTINTGNSVYMGFPLSDASVSLPREFLRIYHYVGNAWQAVPVEAVINGIAYAYVASYSYYAVAKFTNVIRVNPNFTTPLPPGDYKYLQDAISAIPISTTNKYVILILGDATRALTYTLSNVELPKRTSIIGGFANMPDQFSTTGSGSAGTTIVRVATGMGVKFQIHDHFEISNGYNTEVREVGSVMGDELGFTQPLANSYTNSPVRRKLPTEIEIVNDPKKYPTILEQAVDNEPILKITTTTPEVERIDTYVDGLTLQMATFSSGSYAALYLYSGKHWTDLYVRNCSFLNNQGDLASAVYLYNVSKVHFQHCVFANNTTTGDFAGSAVRAIQVFDCGAGASFESCVFYNNTAGGSGSAPILDAYDSETKNASIFLEFRNCTMYKNSGTAVILSPSSLPNKIIPITNCIFADNTISGTEIVSPSNQFFSNPTQTTDLGNLTSNPGFVNASSPAAIIGQDGILGTHDDGLQLSMTSSARNTSKTIDRSSKSIPIPDFDVTGRRRGPGVGDADVGAYERYINILTIGDYNTLGEAGTYCYQGFLKDEAKRNDAKYMIDFVGPGVTHLSYDAVINGYLEREPSNKSDEGMYDVNTAAAYSNDQSVGTVAYFKQESVLTKITSTQFDYALVNIGATDVEKNTPRTTIYSDIISFLTQLTTACPGKKVFITSLPCKTDDEFDKYYQFNYGNFTNADKGFYGLTLPSGVIRIGSINTTDGSIYDMNKDGYMAAYIGDANHLKKVEGASNGADGGFKKFGQTWWQEILVNMIP